MWLFEIGMWVAHKNPWSACLLLVVKGQGSKNIYYVLSSLSCSNISDVCVLSRDGEGLSVTFYIGVFWRLSCLCLRVGQGTKFYCNYRSHLPLWGIEMWKVRQQTAIERELPEKTQTNLNEHISWCAIGMFQCMNIKLILDNFKY